MNSEKNRTVPQGHLGVDDLPSTPERPETPVESNLEFEELSEQATSAHERITTLAEGNDKEVLALEKKYDASPEDITSARTSMGFAERWKSIRDEASNLADKLGRALSRTSTPRSGVEAPSSGHSTEIERGIRREREINAPLIKEAIKKRNELFEGRGLFTLSKDDFNDYFATFAGEDFEIRPDLQQRNVGDCFAVAAIHALTCSPHFEMIVRSSVERLADGSWVVRVPLLSDEGLPVPISQEELKPQKNERFLKLDDEPIDIRPRLQPLKGKEGLQVLEAAFIKQEFGTVDRLAAEGGWGDDVLVTLGGENFVRRHLNAARYDAQEGKWQYPGLDSLPPDQAPFLDDLLEGFDPELHIATASTRHFDNSTTLGKLVNIAGVYKGAHTGKLFVPGHAYSVSNVDREKRMITLANPWDTTIPFELTFEQFKGTFSAIGAIRVDSAKLLSNMEKIAKKAA